MSNKTMPDEPNAIQLQCLMSQGFDEEAARGFWSKLWLWADDAAQPVAGDAVRALPAEWRERAEELDLGDPIGVTHHWKLKDCADELEAALSASRGYDHG